MKKALKNLYVRRLDIEYKRIEEYSLKYRELYTEIYELLEGYSETSIQTHLLKGVSKVSKVTGEMIEKIPVISKGQLDETLIEASDKLEGIKAKRTEKTMRELVDRQYSYVRPFVENINMINRVYNSDLAIAFDSENLYIGQM